MLANIIHASSIVLQGGTIIAFDDSTSSLNILRCGSLHIVNDRIHAIYDETQSATFPADTQFINVTNHIVSPGFIDTHRHGWQTAFKTIGSNTSLPEYFHRFGEFPSEGKLDSEDVYIGQLAGLLEAINAGVTTTLDHAHGIWGDDTADAGLNASIDSGARVFYGHTIHQLDNGYTIENQIAKLKSYATMDLSNTSVEIGLAYDGWVTSPADVTAKVVDVAKNVNLSVITTHFLGGPWKYGNSPAVMHSLGLLNRTTPFVFSHGSFMDATDLSLLRSTDQYLSITPESELQYGHSNVNSQLILDQACVGVDTHFTFSTDIVTQVRMWLQEVRNRLYNQVLLSRWHAAATNPMSANQAFLLGTRNGGLALHRDYIGVIKVGAKADIVVYDGMSPGMLGWVDPVAAVIMHSNVGDVKHVLVDGKFVKRDGKLTIEDYSGIQQRFLKSARKIQRVYKDFPSAVLEGSFNDITLYEDPTQVDILRGDGTGYGVKYL
ncbi:hypothetical protein BGZ60DRAFT_369717 [Tricladium varicosporioides]|nr:hypothetical protein BGZ60DRAFT_369717 [Hymenoscyphus varicosporioides]